jgi:hypothetical protein
MPQDGSLLSSGFRNATRAGKHLSVRHQLAFLNDHAA